MRRSAGATRPGRVLGWLIVFPVLFAFLAMHVVSCSFAVGQSQAHEHQPAAHAMGSDHGPLPSAPGNECDHQQHDDSAGDVCVTVYRPSNLLAAGLDSLPAALMVSLPVVADPGTGPPGPRDAATPAEPRSGRHLLISLNVART